MQRFFQSISVLHQYTLSLRWNQQHLCCPHCKKHDQWVSHGFAYKQISIDQSVPVGKRILCSNRFGRSGCGRTHRLYCADRAPFIHYSLSVCIAFLLALLIDKRHTVDSAYRQATGAADARNAWRWLNKLDFNLASFRPFQLPRRKLIENAHCATLSPLLNTLKNLLTLFASSSAEAFQLNTQTAFL